MRRAVEADATLALQDDHARVEQAQAPHLAVAAKEHGLGQPRIRLGIRGAVVSKDAEEACVELEVGHFPQMPNHVGSVPLQLIRLHFSPDGHPPLPAPASAAICVSYGPLWPLL